jgi:hypothetical protein
MMGKANEKRKGESCFWGTLGQPETLGQILR